ncbi:MAG: hypothetical protein SNJ68_08770 [Cyanobacteriota bacterium]
MFCFPESVGGVITSLGWFSYKGISVGWGSLMININKRLGRCTVRYPEE